MAKMVKLAKKGVPVLLLAFLLLGGLLPVAHAAPIIINDDLTGQLRFRGLPQRNEDGSTTYRGVIYRGRAEGDLPGRWLMILQVTTPAGGTTGDVAGTLTVGARQESLVYGTLLGTMDPTAGEFNCAVVVVGGTGIYEGATGAGLFQGTLENGGQHISGMLFLLLQPGKD
ncbi:MAG: hypothetical protein QHJ81_08515 [Anaerolineae bacterium]|nr:hypothetical protein [Anaerolineae bacterium]